MQINALQIRVGNILVKENELYRVTYTQHVTPGKGVACMQTKMKSIQSGKNLEKRFRSAEFVEKASLESKSMQYLYMEGDDLVMMDNESFEQLQVSVDLLGDGAQFLKEGESYNLSFFNDTVVGVELPKSVALKVTVAPPEVKKATASASLRPVTLENGMEVQAPVFIKEGDTIKINTETMAYIERV